MTDLETTSCPLCGASGGLTVLGGAGFAPYAVVACPGCGLQYLSPRLTEAAMATHYASDHYFQGGVQGYDDYARQEPALRATFRRFLQALARRGRAKGALLEVGCGYGYLLDEARPFFRRRVGTDFSPAAVEVAAGRADAVYLGGGDAVPAGERFDCIMATHVIEHVYRPHEFVRRLMQHLAPGGTLVLAAPDAGSFWRRAMGRRWPSFKLPEHVLYFDRHTLSRLMSECGLRQLAPLPYPHAFPLPLIGAKLGLRLPRSLNGIHLWLPATTVAVMGVKEDG
jgi:SAM-dependent methyltransferase